MCAMHLGMVPGTQQTLNQAEDEGFNLIYKKSENVHRVGPCQLWAV